MSLIGFAGQAWNTSSLRLPGKGIITSLLRVFGREV
ncbi:MAG: hypothetical protein ACI8PB_005029, partial [Desulforhopalus sp.]